MLGVFVFLLAGCASAPEREPLPLQSAPPFSESGTALVPDEWWRALDDPLLYARIERALRGNFTLASAWERLRAAEALARRESAALWPDLDATGSAETRDNDGGPENGADEAFSFGVAASYEIDLWGRIGSQAEAERLRAAASRADYEAAALSLAGVVASVHFQYNEALLQLRLLAEQVETNETVVDLLRKRFARGQIRSADILRQEQLTEATREDAILVEARAAILRHQLAILQGIPPQAIAPERAGSLPGLPPLPGTGLPAELVQRRPDVRAAFLRLQAADREVAAAVRAQYPRLELGGSVTTTAGTPSELFEEWLFTLLGEATAPLLDGGERRAEVARTAALRAEALRLYGQTVLEAFAEVEDALAREEARRDRIDSLRIQVDLARRTYAQLRTQYFNGLVDYIAVLAALTDEQRLRRDLLTAQREGIENRTQLYRALAGGFDTQQYRSPAGE